MKKKKKKNVRKQRKRIEEKKKRRERKKEKREKWREGTKQTSAVHQATEFRGCLLATSPVQARVGRERARERENEFDEGRESNWQRSRT